MAVLSIFIYRFNLIPIRILADFLAEIEKLIPLTAKTVMKKKSKVGRLTFLDFKTYYKASVIRLAW